MDFHLFKFCLKTCTSIIIYNFASIVPADLLMEFILEVEREKASVSMFVDLKNVFLFQLIVHFGGVVDAGWKARSSARSRLSPHTFLRGPQPRGFVYVLVYYSEFWSVTLIQVSRFLLLSLHFYTHWTLYVKRLL